MSTATSVAVGATKPLQPTSEGPASPVKHYAADGSGVRIVPGTNIKMLPIPDFAKGEYDGSPEYRAFLDERTEWIKSVVRANGRIVDAWQMLMDAGHTVTLKALYNRNERAKFDGVASTPSVPEDESPPPPQQIDVEEISQHARAHSDTLAGVQMIVDAAVERMRADLMAEIEELKPKAAKWAQLRKIRDLLGAKE